MLLNQSSHSIPGSLILLSIFFLICLHESPLFLLQVSIAFDKCTVFFIYHPHTEQKSFAPLRNSPVLHLSTWKPLVFSLSLEFSFSRVQINGIIYCVDFSSWFLYLQRAFKTHLYLCVAGWFIPFYN